MSDEEAIRNLLARSWQYVDDRRSVDWLALFDADARIETVGVAAHGISEIRTMADEIGGHQWVGCHLGTNISIEVDGDQAQAVSDVIFLIPDGVSFTDVEENTRGTRILYMDRCSDALIKRDGRWLFTERVMENRVGTHPHPDTPVRFR